PGRNVRHVRADRVDERQFPVVVDPERERALPLTTWRRVTDLERLGHRLHGGHLTSAALPNRPPSVTIVDQPCRSVRPSGTSPTPTPTAAPMASAHQAPSNTS